MSVDVDVDPHRLKAVLRDFVALSAIPAISVGREPEAVVINLADSLVEVLQLDGAFVRMSEPGGDTAIEVTRGRAGTDLHAAVKSLGNASPQPANREFALDLGAGSCVGLAIPVGVTGEAGLVVAASRRSDFPSAVDRVLLSLAANHASIAFENARLIQERDRAEERLRAAHDELEAKVVERTADLNIANEELAASRLRIVAASDEARRQIERDLHDGVQQQLVSIELALAVLKADAPAALSEPLANVIQHVDFALRDLVEIARGIHPAIISQGGLAAALGALARRSAVCVELHAQINDPLPDEVEVAAYYVAAEALTNVAKYARASQATIDVATDGGTLTLIVRDDGIGGADPGRGSGLVGLRDRVEALGGTITVDSPARSGTCVSVTLPIPAEPA